MAKTAPLPELKSFLDIEFDDDDEDDEDYMPGKVCHEHIITRTCHQIEMIYNDF